MRRFSLAFLSVLVLLAQGLAGCGGSSTAPTGALGSLSLSGMFPNSGPSGGGTPVRIFGSGFGFGNRVTVDGVGIEAMVVSSTVLTATMPAHAAGPVDVIVTRPSGESASLSAAYSYLFVAPPAVIEVAPNVGSIDGDTVVTLTGSGFAPGAAVRIGGIAQPAYVLDRTRLIFASPAHAAGTVSVIVTNPDGQAATAEFSYVPPDTFDFNGDWEGGAGSEFDIAMRFTIQNSALISVSCGTPAVHTFSPPVPVSAGRFSLEGSGGVSVSGRIVATAQAVGTIVMPSCGTLGWRASKR